MTIRTTLLLAATCALGGTLACGDGGGNGPRGGQATAQEPGAEARAAAADGSIGNGRPMPRAAEASGVPPYPNAIVWSRYQRPPSEFHTFEAFTPDSFLQVVAFYDQALPGWRRTVAKDAVHYHQDPDLASVVLAPWEGQDIPEDGPEELRPMRTSIGVAWKKGL